MGRFVDLDKPLSVEDKAYLERRRRGYLIAANERRFGKDGIKEPEPHELAGITPDSLYVDTEARAQAVYDTGGAPLPDTTLDYNTGRVFHRENGVTVSPNIAGHTPGAYETPFNEGFNERNDDDDADIDEDIVDHVLELSIKDLESGLKESGLEVPGHKDISELTVDQLLYNLVEKEVQTEKTDKKADLQKRLKEKLSQERKEAMQNILAIHLQDTRDGK